MVIDLEMTGLSVDEDRICEVALIRYEGGVEVARFEQLVRPDARMSPGAFKVHRIRPEQLDEAPTFEQVWPRIKPLLAGAVWVAHNVVFDRSFLRRAVERLGEDLEAPLCLDTLLMARRLFAFSRNHLSAVCKQLGVEVTHSHRAMADAQATSSALHEMLLIIDPLQQVSVGEMIDLVDALAPNSSLRQSQHLRLLHCHRDRQTAFIDYTSTRDVREAWVRREVAIWLIRPPYVQGWCFLKEAERIFRMDRIRRVMRGRRTYDIPDFVDRI